MSWRMKAYVEVDNVWKEYQAPFGLSGVLKQSESIPEIVSGVTKVSSGSKIWMINSR